MNLFSFLFKKHSTLSTRPIDDSDPRADGPPCANIKLWEHQRAMLQRCIDIEKSDMQINITPSNAARYGKDKPVSFQCGIGIMNDPPGCGKTFVILSLIALDKKQTTNIVITPPNLHHQWVDAVQTFLPRGIIRWKSVTEYNDVISLIKPGKQLNPFDNIDLVITTTEYAEPIISTFPMTESIPHIDRIIIDEVDSSSSSFHNIPYCKRVWFLSASFDPSNHQNIGPFDLSTLDSENVRRLICLCDETFMSTHQPPIQEPVTQVIQVYDGDISLFIDILNKEEIRKLNAMNFKDVYVNVLRRFKGSAPTSVSSLRELAECMYNDLSGYVDSMIERCNDLENDPEHPIVEKWLNEKDSIMQTSKLLESRLAAIKGTQLSKKETKLDHVSSNICSMMKNDLDSKWIFFNDDFSVFDDIGEILKNHSINYTTLFEGTISKNVASLNRYKSDPCVRVIFINSIKDGCGLNMENTTHILFLHRTDQNLVEQVVGRAQRPGRKSQLRIICLYHENEIFQNL